MVNTGRCSMQTGLAVGMDQRVPHLLSCIVGLIHGYLASASQTDVNICSTCNLLLLAVRL